MAKKKKTARSKKPDFNNNPFNHLEGFATSGLEKTESKLTVTESVPDEVFGSFTDEMKMLGVKQIDQTEAFEEAELDSSIPVEDCTAKDEELSEEMLFLAAMGDLTVTFEDSFVADTPRPGAMPKRIKQVKQGKLIPDASLDLHGLQCAEVVDKLQYFFQNARHHDWQTLLVITGKGLHSEDGEPALRNEVERYLSAEGKKQVIEWSRAPRQYGGDGALILFLPQR
ncbi:MAG: Smr/MutS family protein [Desulfuromusa sp.]|nr:Smr/MutS family protein [Desulfuromusa sp.]